MNRNAERVTHLNQEIRFGEGFLEEGTLAAAAAAAAAKSLQSCPTLCGPHRWLPRPWDSPGKNTGVSCHFLLQCMEVKSESEVAQSCPTLSDPIGLQPTRLLRPWDSPGKSTGVGCHCWLENRAKNRILFSCSTGTYFLLFSLCLDLRQS